MKYSFTLSALAAVASAHYQLDSLVVGGKQTTPVYSDVRQWTGYYTNGQSQSLSPSPQC